MTAPKIDSLGDSRIDELAKGIQTSVSREEAISMSQEIAKTRRLPDHSSGVKYPALAGEAIEKIISRVGGFERAEQVRIIAAVRAYFNTYGEDGFKPSRRESLPVGAQRILDPESP